MKIFIGTDHAGFHLKEALKAYLKEEGYEVVDCGNAAFDPDDNYPDFILPVAKEVAKDKEARGIVIGGSGQGEAMAANRVPGVRAAVFYGSVQPKQAVDASGRESDDPYELLKLSRVHNNSNVLSLGARFITEEEAKQAVNAWLNTEFDGGERYQRRIAQVEDFSANG